MSSKERVAAKEGWYTIDPDNAHLIGGKCDSCGTFSFPAEKVFCKNPACSGDSFSEVALSTRGKIWSYTNACYQSPEPYIATTDPYEPFTLAAVELEAEGMIVLGQMTPGVTVDDIKVGDPVQLVVGTLYEDDTHDYITWRWQPAGTGAAA